MAGVGVMATSAKRRRRHTLRASRLALVAAVLSLLSCNAFQRAGPDAAPTVNPPRLVPVTIEYTQVNECVAGSPRCEDNVVFFGSWMQAGQEFFLRKEPGRFVWKGTAPDVPVNFPPRGQPYFVRVYDPHVVGSPTEGVTAERLKVGGEAITRFYSPGNAYESGMVFVDDNGQGHSPY
jgi:hypothetical protein